MSVIDWLIYAAMLVSLGGLAILVREAVVWVVRRRDDRRRAGRSVVVQCWGFSARGHTLRDDATQLDLEDAELLDESAHGSTWAPVDGTLEIPRPGVRYVQVL
jgi:hypothetical protein